MMAYSDLNAIKNALAVSSWNCLKKRGTMSQKISTLILSPERNLEAVTEGLQRWKEHTGPLSWNLTVHSLLLHTDSRSSRVLSVATCVLLESGSTFGRSIREIIIKSERDALWLQIQGLVEKLGVLLLKNIKKEQCGVDDFTPEKKGPDNYPRPGIGDSSKKGGNMTKIRHGYKAKKPLKHAVKELEAKRRNSRKAVIKLPKSSSDTFTVSRPKLQRQHGDIENRSNNKYPLICDTHADSRIGSWFLENNLYASLSFTLCSM